jgi:hypothetical protein
MMQDFNLSEKMGYSGKGLDFLKQTTMTNILEQAADAWVEKYSFRVPYDGSNNFYDEEAAKHGRAGFIAGATSPEAKAYNGQGWVELDEKLPDDGESVWFYTPKFKKVLPGHFVKQDSFNRENVFISSDGGYYESLIVSHYMINRFPSPPNTEK